jgi:hypothetical protein
VEQEHRIGNLLKSVCRPRNRLVQYLQETPKLYKTDINPFSNWNLFGIYDYTGASNWGACVLSSSSRWDRGFYVPALVVG